MHALRQLICKCAWGDRNVPTQNCIYETNPGEDHTHLELGSRPSSRKSGAGPSMHIYMPNPDSCDDASALDPAERAEQPNHTGCPQMQYVRYVWVGPPTINATTATRAKKNTTLEDFSFFFLTYAPLARATDSCSHVFLELYIYLARRNLVIQLSHELD